MAPEDVEKKLAPCATAADIRRRVADALPGAEVMVDDDSAAHAGHAGQRERGGGHYQVRVVWEEFAGQSRLARHRRVYAALAELLAAGSIHALALDLQTPEEAGA